MKRFIYSLIFIVLAVAFFACKDDNNLEELRKNELALLDDYIQNSDKNFVSRPSGLYYYEEVAGTGDSIVPGDKVQIFYAVWNIDSLLKEETNGYTNGYRFDPLEFTVKPAQNLSSSSATSIEEIPGLHEAMTYMKNGTVANLVMNSELAYGQNGNSYYGIGGFATLLMQVKVHKVYPANPSTE